METVPQHLCTPGVMDSELYSRWVKLISERTGISLPPTRKSFLLTGLNIRMRELGYTDYQTYYDYLTSAKQGVVEWEILVDRLTVHETRFYRDTHALDLVRDVYLSPLAKDSNLEKGSPVKIDIWSVGCATGEESYSLALLIDDFFYRVGMQCYQGITASDISLAALAMGRKGVYHRSRLTNLPQGYLEKYFSQVDADHYQVNKSIKDRVCFINLNLLDLDKTNVGQMDIIFCQNVLIYFQREYRFDFLNGLVEHLRPGGLLILGAGEVLGWSHPCMAGIRYESTLAYRRKQISE